MPSAPLRKPVSPDPIRTHVEMLHDLATGGDGVFVVSVFFAAGGEGTITHHRIGDVDGMVAAIDAHSGTEGANVYAGLQIMRTSLARGERGGKGDVKAVLGLVADMDSDTGKTGELPFEPSYIVETSPGNQQPVWLFDKPLTPTEAAPLAAALQRATGSDSGTKDIAHVWRIPGTKNWPNEAKLKRGRPADPADVRYLQEWDGELIKVDDFRAALVPWKSAPETEAKPVQLGDLPDVDGVAVSDGLAALLASNDVEDRSVHASAVVERLAFDGHSAEEAAALFLSATGNWLDRYPKEAAAVRDFERMWGKDRARRDVWDPWLKVASDLTALLLSNFANDNASGSTHRRAHAKELSGYIGAALKGLLPDGKDAPDEFAVDMDVVDRIVGGTFWDANRSKLYTLHAGDQSLVFCSMSDADMFIKRTHGYPVDIAAAGTMLFSFDPERFGNDKSEAIKMVKAVVHKQIMDHIKLHNQRSRIEYRVDMFAKDARVVIMEHSARIIFPHKRLVADGTIDEEIIADYRQHFPEIDEVLGLIVAARFADDRKKAFLWLLALSDWGKGFLIGAFKALGLVVEMSVKEIEAIFEGKPAGRSPTDFVRAFILLVDEFKVVKSELKQLQSTIQLAPKFLMMCEVEVFLKMFTSAEEVGSLVGSNGVEDQFANRFSLINKLDAGTIESRPLFKDAGGRYHSAVTAYVACEINRLIADYQAMGLDAAQKRGRDVLDGFIAKYGIALTYGRMSDGIGDLAAEFIRWVVDQDRQREVSGREAPRLIRRGSGDVYLPAAGKAFEDYVQAQVGHSERATVGRKVNAVLKALCPDRSGSGTYRIPKPTRAVKINPCLLV